METVSMACRDCIGIVTIDNPPDNHLDLKVLSGLNEGYEPGLRQEVAALGDAFDPGTKQWERM